MSNLKIDKTVCLTLDKRYNQGLLIQQQAKQLGINVQLFVTGDGNLDVPYNRNNVQSLPPNLNRSTSYPTWWASHRPYNCRLSQKTIIKQAIDEHVNTLLLLEDDVKFETDFSEILHKVIPSLDMLEWDALYLGCFAKNPKPTDNPHLYRLGGSGGGFHGIIMKRNIMKLLIEIPDYGPSDWLLEQYHHLYNCYMVYPSIVTQMDGFSWIESQNLVKPSRYSI